jgi:HD-GYP domain-containing protein (c-di-GMP phosphodiesterase class II)/Tfp pilus assembly protein PilZ
MSKDATPLYNSRVTNLYLTVLRERYPQVSINDILDYAGMESYETCDEGHWFTQEQVDRFYEKIVQLTGNETIAREAGRMAGSPGAIGIMRQYTLGMLGPARAFQAINRASKHFTLSSEYRSLSLKSNQVELTVTPYAGVKEKPFQCENRMGFFEALIGGFKLGHPKIEHPECLFTGGTCCRYIITWKDTLASQLGKIRDGVIAASSLGLVALLFTAPETALRVGLPLALLSSTAAALAAEIARRREMGRAMANLWDSSERLTEQINANSRNLQLAQELGQALANKKSVEDVLRSVVKVMEKRLDFDCGAILLADPTKTCLEIRGAFGYTTQQLGDLTATVFRLDNPNSQGPFVQAFHQKKPYMISNVKEIEGKVTPKSRKFIECLGILSFLCCPIIVENESLGVLAVTNQTSKRPLVKRDVSLLQGVAPVIGVALQNASLVEEGQLAFEKTLKILADSIDARDFLTAGHSDVVSEYAAGITEEMGLGDEYVQMIRISALLHDYGKIGVPDSILKKNGHLTKEERAIINTHPAKTREILSQVPFRGIQTQIPEITGSHHERWDGKGYPAGLKGEDIHLGARILAVADFFEAITAKRHYREPMTLDTALCLLQEESGRHFDPAVVNAFVRYLHSRKFCLLTPESQLERSTMGAEISRRGRRIEYRTPVSAQCDRRVLSGSMLDIGPQGAYVASSDPVEESMTLTLTFVPPGSDQLVQIEGKVAWINKEKVDTKHPEGFGLQFKEVPDQVQSLLNSFVEHQHPTGSTVGKVIYPKNFAK